jgi:hypothetical protein
MSTADGEIGLESAIANVYGGPVEEFVRRRDALAKELRTAGRKDEASAVKGLRKPSRMAWALDMAALQAGDAKDELDRAVAATLEAQAVDGDVKGATVRLRLAVREFAGHAAHAAEEAGHRLEQAALANAVLAVLGKTDAFSALRRGCLVDVPEAGGLDFLSSLPAPQLVSRPEQAKPREVPATPPASPERPEIEVAARAAARQAGIVRATARERSEEAQRAFRQAEAKLQAAQEHLRQAEMAERALRTQRDRAREETEEANARLLEAERAAEEADSQLARLGREPD